MRQAPKTYKQKNPEKRTLVDSFLQYSPRQNRFSSLLEMLALFSRLSYLHKLNPFHPSLFHLANTMATRIYIDIDIAAAAARQVTKMRK